MQILVFKTNLTSAEHVNHVQPHLNLHPAIHKWNVDLEDCDKILRIESAFMNAAEVEQLIVKAGYYCEELQ
jgi:hypothetical protein